MIRRPRSVSGEIGAYLEQLIATELTPGDKLPTERELAERLAVSRTSVREALHALERRRVVDRRPGRGTIVLPPDARAQDLAELMDDVADGRRERADVAELRLVIEPRIAGLAAARATDTDLAQLERILTDSHAGLSPDESLALDRDFHVQLATASGNPLLVTLCDLVSGWTADVRRRSHATRAGRRSSVEGHRAILAAVAVHDAGAAEAAMTRHLQDVAQLVEPAADPTARGDR
ncbi:FCD domain-containing protein [Nakamurella sp. YIM 132087]|uniref:FCD domain-containing protein n=1 Tax=Nakamurella alba TaxID=2665158 RepID=A0A7K1FND9_9ACTN|nr:FCD domain-containing protein [Nakamurella alba]